MTVGEKKYDYRYSIIPARAITDHRVCAQALRVLALLGRHTGDNGWCRRSQVKMAKELSCGRATVQRGLDELVAAGYVERRRETRTEFEVTEDEQPHTAHSYRVRLDLEDIDGQGGARGRAPGDVPTDEHAVPANSGHAVPILRAPLTEPSPSEDAPPNSLAPFGAREEAIASFGAGEPGRWRDFRSIVADVWPSGFPADDEGKAKDVFVRLTRTTTADVLIRCARAHGEALAKQASSRPASAGKMLVKRPSNWLRDRGWEGYVEQAAEADAREKDLALALGRVQAALGPGLMEILRDIGMQPHAIAMLDGMTYDEGPPPILAGTSRHRLVLERHAFTLQRRLGEDFEIVITGSERKSA